MSGGFFRGTSADQDTRFSNKQAKLLKSQKFASELDHLVDMGKVKMDVLRPWIANRVTELLGFEDEVLINFIYGLLDGKEVNGKEVQISLTGFMEKNTGKFMKELWSLLLSAQKNESGVPQQFLDAKAEEARKKQEELDRITNEIQKKKEESREYDQERSRKMDGEANDTAVAPASKRLLQKDSSGYPEDEKEMNKKNGMRGRRGSTPRMSRSLSNSKSYSGDRKKSRSLSRSPGAQSRSLSSDGVDTSPRKQSITPRWRRSPQVSPSPPPRRSSYYRRRSRSLSHHGSPSPVRRRLRSPFRRRSPSPLRHRRLPSPVRRRRSPLSVRRRRSPLSVRRRRSPSPVRRRRSPSPARHCISPSPIRHRSPSPVRHRLPSPIRRMSPPRPRRRSPSPLPRRYQRSPSSPQLRSVSPVRRRSPVPARRMSPPPSHHRSPSPYQSSSPSPVHSRSPAPPRRRSPAPSNRRSSPYGSGSLSPAQGRSPFPVHRRSPAPSSHRSPSHYGSSFASPDHHRSPSPVRRSSKEKRALPGSSRGERDRAQKKLSPSPHHHTRSLRSPNGNSSRHKVPAFSPSPVRSPIVSESPPLVQNRSPGEDRSPYGSTAGKRRLQVKSDDHSSPPKVREHKHCHYGHDASREDLEIDPSRRDGDYKSSSAQKQSIDPASETKRKGSLVRAYKRDDNDLHDFERLRGHLTTESHSFPDKMEPMEKDKQIRRAEDLKFDERSLSYSNTAKGIDHDKSESTPMLVEQVTHGNGGNYDSTSASSDKHRNNNKEKRKHKKLHRREPAASSDDYSNDSEVDEKEAKRRRKEEKRLQKEEKRRRREERRRRKEKRRAEKLKMRGRYDSSSSDDEHGQRKESCPSDDEERRSEQKKLEIELRKKALESLNAKKGLSH